MAPKVSYPTLARIRYMTSPLPTAARIEASARRLVRLCISLHTAKMFCGGGGKHRGDA